MMAHWHGLSFWLFVCDFSCAQSSSEYHKPHAGAEVCICYAWHARHVLAEPALLQVRSMQAS